MLEETWKPGPFLGKRKELYGVGPSIYGGLNYLSGYEYNCWNVE